MAIPEEDRGPAWLRDWQYIEADIQAMDDFAKKLRAEVETNYVTHLTPLYDDMTTTLPAVDAGFAELYGLLATHQEVSSTTAHQVRDYANRSAGMAAAASNISANYRDADAFAEATVKSVNRALGSSGVAVTGSGDPGSPASPGSSSEGETIPATEVS